MPEIRKRDNGHHSKLIVLSQQALGLLLLYCSMNSSVIPSGRNSLHQLWSLVLDRNVSHIMSALHAASHCWGACEELFQLYLRGEKGKGRGGGGGGRIKRGGGSRREECKSKSISLWDIVNNECVHRSWLQTVFQHVQKCNVCKYSYTTMNNSWLINFGTDSLLRYTVSMDIVCTVKTDRLSKHHCSLLLWTKTSGKTSFMIVDLLEVRLKQGVVCMETFD